MPDRCSPAGANEGSDSFPENLDTNAKQDKGHQPHDHVHCGFAQQSRQTFGEAIAEENSKRDQCRADKRSDQLPISMDPVNSQKLFNAIFRDRILREELE
jgi:hypothetical protein